MALKLLMELLDTTSAEAPEVKGSKSKINHIAQALFGRDAGPVKDLKRSKEAKFYGVAHAKSVLTDARGNAVRLTFDNSTDSGEFELNSLVPLGIVRGSAEDKAIKALYKTYEVDSSARTSYVVSGDQTLLRAVHLGTSIGGGASKMARAIIKLLKKAEPESAEPAEDEEPAAEPGAEEAEKPAAKRSTARAPEAKKPEVKAPAVKEPTEKPLKKPARSKEELQ